MRWARFAALFLGISVARCAAAPAPTSTPARRAPYVNTGDPLPEEPLRDPACKDAQAGATRWIDSDPHTPLAITDGQGIHSAGEACCSPWARAGTRWRAIGRYGEVVGKAVVAGGEGYDVTQCYELVFRMVEGHEGVGLFASERGTWMPPARSSEWRPSAAERQSFEAFAAEAERVLVDDPRPEHDKPVLPLFERTLFFQLPRGASGDGSVEDFGHYAAVGGRFFVIVRLNERGRWVLSEFDERVLESSFPASFQPLAVFDLDGDGYPEVVYHWNAAASWSDAVLRLDESATKWEVVAESIGGSTA